MVYVGKFLIYLLIALLPSVSMMVALDPVMAQERRSFFDKLFGTKKNIQETKKVNEPTIRKKGKTKSSSRNRGKGGKNSKRKSPNASVKPRVEKSPNAKRILVVGDFMAAHVADGLIALYADNPDFLVVKQVEAASGLVRDDYYNWPANIDVLITSHNPDMIIAALGSNDRQALRLGGQSFEYGGEMWISHYRDRVKLLINSFVQDEQGNARQNKRILTWFGLPPFQKPQLSASALMLNSYFEEEIKNVGGHFIDVWRGFVDNKGNFDFSGYDGQGQLARLRTADGINFTASGRAKLAFYADKAVQAFLVRQVDSDRIVEIIEAQLLETLPQAQATNSVMSQNQFKHIKFVPPQSLFDVPDSMPELTGVKNDAHPHLIRISPLQPGRADYFLDEAHIASYPPAGG